MRTGSSVGSELAWLALFVVIFVTFTVIMLKYVVPLHFNDRIAVTIAAILAGLAFIGVRTWITRRAGG